MTFDPAKRETTLRERGLDIRDAAVVLAGRHFTFEDVRVTYGGTRNVTVGLLAGRMVIVVWTPRGQDRHVFSMRKANDREQARYLPDLADLVGETDLARVDAHVVQPEEHDDMPDLTDAMTADAEIRIGDRVVRRARGRPRQAVTKQQVTLRLDPDVVEGLRATGPGWQARANAALKAWLSRAAAS